MATDLCTAETATKKGNKTDQETVTKSSFSSNNITQKIGQAVDFLILIDSLPILHYHSKSKAN